ncbi:MAG: glycosyltransferase family 2 protein, partial [Treponema sp.]|nr:glycosyltransferase family 2 protein [Treponema sp.]
MPNKNPLFSVIVPVYGVKDFLPKCIESVLNQTYSDFELILVDDGSTDGSGETCDEYSRKDSRISVIHKPNGGQTPARKAGAEVSKGDYVVCLDGDDWIGEKYLENFASTIEEYQPDVIITGCVWWKSENDFTTAKVSSGVYGYPLSAGFYDKEKIQDLIFPHLIEDRKSLNIQNSVWGKCFKRELYVPIQLSVDDSVRMGEDACVVKPCISKAEKIVVLDNAEYFYRQLQISMTRNSSSYKWNSPEVISLHLEKQINPLTEDFQNQIYRN